MMKMNNKVFIYTAAAVLVAIAALAAYGLSGGLDVVGRLSVPAFEEVLKSLPEEPAWDEAMSGWSILAPDGSARFVWGKWSGAETSRNLAVEFDSAPFVKAGLSLDLLPEGMALGENIAVGTKLGNASGAFDGEATPIGSFKRIVELNRESIKYHADMDHFGISLGNGNMFEWAKDPVKNDKDIVFVLDPKPFIEAGADPSGIDGWVFGKVKVMDGKGRLVEVEKLLKPYNLDERK